MKSFLVISLSVTSLHAMPMFAASKTSLCVASLICGLNACAPAPPQAQSREEAKELTPAAHNEVKQNFLQTLQSAKGFVYTDYTCRSDGQRCANPRVVHISPGELFGQPNGQRHSQALEILRDPQSVCLMESEDTFRCEAAALPDSYEEVMQENRVTIIVVNSQGKLIRFNDMGDYFGSAIEIDEKPPNRR